jgi:hypothetical protein
MTQMEKINKMYKEPKTGGFVNKKVSVAVYFKQRLKVEPNDKTLYNLEADSVCGRACLAVIDSATHFLSLTDSHPSIVKPLIAATNAAVEVYWRG